MPDPFDALWAATLEHVDLDIATQRLTVSCRVEDGGQLTHSQACLQSMFPSFAFFNSIQGPWDYVEITEIHAAKDAAGSVRTEMGFWSQSAGLVVAAASVEIDGRPCLSRGLTKQFPH